MLTWSKTSARTHNAQHAFDAVESIQVHIDHIELIDDYVAGKMHKKPYVEQNCHADCQFGKWLHGEGGKQCTDLNLINSICRNCEEFREHAAQAVLLASMGRTETAKDSMQRARRASNGYLECLALQAVTDR